MGAKATRVIPISQASTPAHQDFSLRLGTTGRPTYIGVACEWGCVMKRILVGLDFSPASREVLEAASRWAQRFGVPLVAMHVVDHPDPPLFEAYASMGDPAWFQSLEPNAQKMMDAWLRDFPGSTGIIRTGKPAKCLADEADADTLLVLGHTGHGMLEMFHLGSTVERVIHRASGDVLIVRVRAPG